MTKNNVLIQDEVDVAKITNLFHDCIKARTLDRKYARNN